VPHQAALGGTSPFVNPQVAFAGKDGGTDRVPSFIAANGPVREARFVKNPDGTADGGVHALFTITGSVGRERMHACAAGLRDATRESNVIFRIPTPTFGAGLIEQIPDAAIAANQGRQCAPEAIAGDQGQAELPRRGPHDHGHDQQQRQRRNDRAVRLEGAEQIAAAVLGRAYTSRFFLF